MPLFSKPSFSIATSTRTLVYMMAVSALATPTAINAERGSTSSYAARGPKSNAQPKTSDPILSLPRIVLEKLVKKAWLDGRDDDYLLRPKRRRRRMPRRCRTQGGYRKYCQGPRIIAKPSALVQARAAHLALGSRPMIRFFFANGPLPTWTKAAGFLKTKKEERGLLFPVPGGKRGRGFGYVRKGSVKKRLHKGIDIGAANGAPIVAARSGLVIYSDNSITGYGNTVVILHADGSSALYAHCTEIKVPAGSYVRRGDVIATIGKTGFANGSHLHFEYRKHRSPRNPRRLFVSDR